MGKRGRWRVKAYDGAGQPILMRAAHAEAVEPDREAVHHRSALRRMLARDEQTEQNRVVRSVLGLSIR